MVCKLLKMNNLRKYITVAIIVLVAFIAYGLWTLPSPKDSSSKGFSAERVAKDIEVISKDFHSVQDPENRLVVRDYLIQRLNSLGADVKLYDYDSVYSKRVDNTINISNIFCELPPLNSEDSTYLMLVAHYDSRSVNIVRGDTLNSYGAADDGYGVGTILELLKLAQEYRSEWSQGLKILFTDAEEVGREGMQHLFDHNPEVFQNVGLLINLESRGNKGPVLLFETSKNNSELLKFYKESANYPFTYTLTSVVYQFIPNYTDFTVVRDTLCGVNFSNIVDINHYHTDLDNYDNISLKSIQHYGEQLSPMVHNYLTDKKYSNVDALKSDSDNVAFTIPLLGMFNFSKGAYYLVNAIVLALFCLAFSISVIRGRVRPKSMIKVSGVTLLVALGLVVVGELVAYLVTLIGGSPDSFKLFGVIQGFLCDGTVMIVTISLLAVITFVLYAKKARKIAISASSGAIRKSASSSATAKFAYNTLYGALLLLLVISIVLLFAVGENLFTLIPLAFAICGLILWRVTTLRLFLIVAVAGVLLHSFSFLYCLAIALTLGAFGVVLMIAFLNLMVLIPLIDLYVRRDKAL